MHVLGEVEEDYESHEATPACGYPGPAMRRGNRGEVSGRVRAVFKLLACGNVGALVELPQNCKIVARCCRQLSLSLALCMHILSFSISNLLYY